MRVEDLRPHFSSKRYGLDFFGSHDSLQTVRKSCNSRLPKNHWRNEPVEPGTLRPIQFLLCGSPWQFDTLGRDFVLTLDFSYKFLLIESNYNLLSGDLRTAERQLQIGCPVGF